MLLNKLVLQEAKLEVKWVVQVEWKVGKVDKVDKVLVQMAINLHALIMHNHNVLMELHLLANPQGVLIKVVLNVQMDQVQNALMDQNLKHHQMEDKVVHKEDKVHLRVVQEVANQEDSFKEVHQEVVEHKVGHHKEVVHKADKEVNEHLHVVIIRNLPVLITQVQFVQMVVLSLPAQMEVGQLVLTKPNQNVPMDLIQNHQKKWVHKVDSKWEVLVPLEEQQLALM